MSRKQVEFHPAAVREAAAAFRWYVERSALAAERFADELDEAVDEIIARPESFPAYLCETQRSLLKRYPYLIVFRQRGTVTQIVAIAHGRRRPGYWHKRGD